MNSVLYEMSEFSDEARDECVGSELVVWVGSYRGVSEVEVLGRLTCEDQARGEP